MLFGTTVVDSELVMTCGEDEVVVVLLARVGDITRVVACMHNTY